MSRSYIIRSPDHNFFAEANLDEYFIAKLDQEFAPYRWDDLTRLALLENILARLDNTNIQDDGALFAMIQPLVMQMIVHSEKVMVDVMHCHDKSMKERTAELIRRLLVDWTA